MGTIDIENKEGNEINGDIFAPSLTIYQREIGKYKTLDRDEERELIIRAQGGDTAARNAIIEANLKFVHKVAMWFTSYGVDMGDLISEGNFGINKAIDRFDVDRGVKFYSYAVWWISQSIREFIEKYKGVRTDDIQERIMSDDGADDDSDHVQKTDGTIPGCVIDEPENEGKTGEEELVGRLMDVLTETERKVIDMMYGMSGNEDEKTLKEIGDELGVSMERVRQIKIKAIRKMRSEYLLTSDD